MNKSDKILLPSYRVKVRLVNPNYPYYGFIIGRDSDFIYLNISQVEDKEEIMLIPFFNIMLIQKEDKKVMSDG